MDVATDSECVVAHRWRVGDVVLWDNRYSQSFDCFDTTSFVRQHRQNAFVVSQVPDALRAAVWRAAGPQRQGRPPAVPPGAGGVDAAHPRPGHGPRAPPLIPCRAMQRPLSVSLPAVLKKVRDERPSLRRVVLKLAPVPRVGLARGEAQVEGGAQQRQRARRPLEQQRQPEIDQQLGGVVRAGEALEPIPPAARNSRLAVDRFQTTVLGRNRALFSPRDGVPGCSSCSRAAGPPPLQLCAKRCTCSGD